MKRITIRECYDKQWAATLEEIQGRCVNPLHVTTGRTVGGALGRMEHDRPEAEAVPLIIRKLDGSVKAVYRGAVPTLKSVYQNPV